MEIEDSRYAICPQAIRNAIRGCFIPKLLSYKFGGIQLWLELGLGLDLSGLCIAGVVASRAQWGFGIFAVGLQMTIKFNQVKPIMSHILQNR